MSSSISSSERLDQVESAARPWRRWLIVFCGTFYGVGALIYLLLLLVDPYDTGRFPNFGIVGILDRSPRTAHASFARDPHFNAAVIGNSTGQLINPYRLSSETGLHFTQLTIPATGPREQLAIMRWVMANHPTYGAFVVVTDISWCSSDPNLPVEYPFPFWLYGGNWDYLANVLSSKALDRIAWRIMIALGLRQPVDPVGYSDYLVNKNVHFQPEPAGHRPDIPNVQWPLPLPWIDRLRAFLASLPQDVRVVLAMPPVFYTSLPEPGTNRAAELEACKTALAKAVPNRPGSGFLDFRVDSEAAHDASDFVDPIHYRYKLSHYMEDQIIAVLDGRGTGGTGAAVESRLNNRSP